MPFISYSGSDNKLRNKIMAKKDTVHAVDFICI